MVKVKIATPYPAPSITQDRFGRTDMVIPYTLDGVGPFEVRLPLETYSTSKGEDAVRERARQQSELKGKEFEV